MLDEVLTMRPIQLSDCVDLFATTFRYMGLKNDVRFRLQRFYGSIL